MACVWMRGILGEAVCEGEQNKCRAEREIVARKAKGAMACVWMRGILGEAVCEGEQNKCRAEREIVARKTKGKQCRALRSAESLVRQ